MTDLIIVHSSFEETESVKKRLSFIIDKLAADKNIFVGEYFTNPNDALKFAGERKTKSNSLIILTATGGTEEITESLISGYNVPTLLLANSQKNSFAASMESYSYLKNKFRVKLFYSDDADEIKSAVVNFIDVINAIDKINSANVGQIGEPSSWLLTSKNVNDFGSFKTKLTRIEVKELAAEVESADLHFVTDVLHKMLENYKNISVDDESLLTSAKVYTAMRAIVEKEKLSAITIRCFDLLDKKYTACMGISLCNDEGIVSGCEGDLHATFSMMIGSYITDQPAWMANPSSVNIKNNSIILAHCTIPSTMLVDKNNSTLTTHMESGLSTAVQGSMKKEKVTIFRTGGSFNKMLITTGEIIDSGMNDPALCRTQAEIKLNCNIEEWIESSLGNHQVIVYGNIQEKLKTFCELTGIDYKILH